MRFGVLWSLPGALALPGRALKQNVSMRLANEGDVWSLLLLEHDCSQRHLLANEFVEGQDLLSAVLISLPLSHLFSRRLTGLLSCETGCSFSWFVWVVFVCFWGLLSRGWDATCIATPS